ncbi:MAG TPA: choice-of-anchor L domain-containing protein, partial [Saprospiraceae bacterium]|nr:choice-of-anchor L domain-containing protein [Saprospiraceae bacterium]
DNVFVICPSQPAACITFTLDYYNLDQSGFGGDVLTFYDGDDINSPILAQIGGAGFGPPSVSGGGAVCFKVMATSGCLTVQMQSDFAVEQEGFVGHWECSSEPCMPVATPTINTNISNQNIVDAVSTPATTVTITNIDCPNDAYGTFSYPTDDNDLGLSQGLLLTSGLATIAIGPNVFTGSGINNLGEGDSDLDYLSQQQGGANSFDACIVELDVFAATDELTFEYVFGSDEYPEFVGSGFNDIFAFFVSGPGIVGDPNLSNNAKNIAIVPGTTNTPVQINSVNNDVNWQFYRNNEIGQSLEYDGLTSDAFGIKKSLTARTDVIPCNTYHLKLAVADRADHIYDSGVFISKIQGGTPNLSVQFASGIDYFIEDCSGNQDVLIISLSEPPTEVTSFLVTVGGTATLGVDYTLSIPNIITFQPGQQQISFPIVPIADALVEGTETITISLSNNFGCGTVIYKTLTINIEDNVNVYVNAGADTVYVCAGATLQLEAFGATNYFWAPPGLVSNPFISNPTITPSQDLWVSVTGTVNNCVDIDSVYVKIISPSIDVTALSPTNICQGTQVLLQAANNVGNSALT